MPRRFLCLTFLRLRAAVVQALRAIIVTLLLWSSLVRVRPVTVSGLLHPLAVLLLNEVVGVGAWLLLLTGARVFRSRSHVPVQLRLAVVCRSTGRCGATRARIHG